MTNCAEKKCSTEIVQLFEGKRMGLIGFHEKDADTLTESFTKMLAATSRLTHQEAWPGAEELHQFDLLLIQVPDSESDEGDNFTWLTEEGMSNNSKPMIMFGLSDKLATRVSLNWKLAIAGTFSNRFDFISHPWKTEDAILRAYNLLLRRMTAAAPTQRAALQGEQTVLVADDDFTTSTLVSATLKKNGLGALVAFNGEEALQMIKQRRPDAVILDINMPVMNGFDVLAQVKKHPETDQIPILILTNHQKETDVIRGFSLGADDFIGKPFSPAELAVRLKRLLPNGTRL